MGGTRTWSPMASRVSASARPLFTRTSPLRMTRCRCDRGTPLSTLAKKLSSRCPTEPSSMVNSDTRSASGEAPGDEPCETPTRPALAPIMVVGTMLL